jgi:hypothetical protein
MHPRTITRDEAECLADVLVRLGLAAHINESRVLCDCLLASTTLMRAILDLPVSESGLDLSAREHRGLLDAALYRVHKGWDSEICIRILRLLDPQRVTGVDGHLHPLIETLFSGCGDLRVIPVIREYIALAGPAGDGVDLTRVDLHRMETGYVQMTALIAFDWRRMLWKARNVRLKRFAAIYKTFARVRRELVSALAGIAHYRRGGVLSAINDALHSTGLHQIELHGLVAALLIVPLSHEHALDQALP